MMKKYSPKLGSFRVVKKFAFLPKTLGWFNNRKLTVWLTSYYIKQEYWYSANSDCAFWVNREYYEENPNECE